MFQTFFPPLPEFQGRQVVTLHNQRDFLFFRRHRYVAIAYHDSVQLPQADAAVSSRYAFRSTEKVALQEIGPRFTLKLRSLKKGLPAVNYLGDVAKPLEFDDFSESEEKADRAAADQLESDAEEKSAETVRPSKKVPPKADEYEWVWKVSAAVIWKVALC